MADGTPAGPLWEDIGTMTGALRRVLSGVRVDRREVPGPLGALGAFLALLTGMATENGFDFVIVLFFSGALNVRTGLVFLLASIVLAGSASAAAGEGTNAESVGERHWSDVLKDIPLGPFHVDVGGSLRLRYEHTSDFNIQRYADDRGRKYASDDFLIHRERLDLNLRFTETARLFVQLQNNDVFNSDFEDKDFFQGQPFTDPLDLRQAYLEWLRILDTPLGFRIGRQAIFYADNRVWGPGEWGNTGRYTWDAAKLIVDLPLAETQLIFANRITYDPDRFDEHDSHLDAYGLYSMVKGLPFNLDLFWIGKHTRPDMVVNAKGDMVDLDTHTVGFYVDGKLRRGWDWGGTFAYTCGDRTATTYSTVGGKKVAATTDDDVRAWGANARLGYTFDHPWEPRLGGQSTVGSGDSNPNPNGRYETFDGAFGAVDLFYGRMNLFSWMNIQDYEINLSIKPVKRVKVSADYHFFCLDQAKDAWYYSTGQAQRRDPSGNSGRDLGHELDMIATYKHSKHLELQAGYAHFWPGGFVKRTGPSPDPDWFFLQTLCSL